MIHNFYNCFYKLSLIKFLLLHMFPLYKKIEIFKKNNNSTLEKNKHPSLSIRIKLLGFLSIFLDKTKISKDLNKNVFFQFYLPSLSL